MSAQTSAISTARVGSEGILIQLEALGLSEANGALQGLSAREVFMYAAGLLAGRNRETSALEFIVEGETVAQTPDFKEVFHNTNHLPKPTDPEAIISGRADLSRIAQEDIHLISTVKALASKESVTSRLGDLKAMIEDLNNNREAVTSFRALSPGLDAISRTAATAECLRMVYEGYEQTPDSRIIDPIAVDWVRGDPVARETFRRKEVVRDLMERHLTEAIFERIKDPSKPRVHVLSVAGGSMQAVLEAVAKVDPEREHTTITLVDNDPNAIRSAKETEKDIANRFQLNTEIFSGNINHIEGNVLKLEDALTKAGISLDGRIIIEANGIFDYLPDSLAKRVLEACKNLVRDGDKILFANVTNYEDDSPARFFLENVVGWRKMINRSVSDVLKLVESAAIETSELTVHHIHETQKPGYLLVDTTVSK